MFILRGVLSCIALALLISPFFLTGQASAQDVTKIAIVDIRKVVGESKAGSHIREQVEEQRSNFVDFIKGKEEELRKKEQELVSKKDTLSKDEFLQQRKSFEAQLMEADKFAKQKNRALEEAYGKAMKKLQDEIFEIVQDIAEENDYTIVLRRQDVMLAAKSTEITDEVLTKLDKTLTKIDLNVKE